ncbi:MAG: tRNA(5-methylaminomethyl-2-thiouridylate) methyltransferase [Desulfonatronovibrionaceae bacterium]
MDRYRAVALFSGGLDSILAARLLQKQGWDVVGLHFFSPFFGHPEDAEHWQTTWDIEIKCVDVTDEYTGLLARGPEFGLGKFLNPCVDCKIFMLKQAKKYMHELGAELIVTGEVLGQRPMSQRRSPLQLIRKRAGVQDVLLRPLSAGMFEPIPAELEGKVDRSRLFSISGRGRKDQLTLARELGVRDIPTPAGGCLLTQAESAKRYLPLFLLADYFPVPNDFRLANIGRQYWSDDLWLCIGRDKADNERLDSVLEERDYCFRLRQFPGPTAIGRPFGPEWPQEMVRSAAAWTSRFAPKARKSLRTVEVEVQRAGESWTINVWPGDCGPAEWQEPQWTQEGKQAVLKRFERQDGL